MSGDCLRGTNSLLKSAILYLGRADAVYEARIPRRLLWSAVTKCETQARAEAEHEARLSQEDQEAALDSNDAVRDSGQSRGLT
jgi:hypothetical protein